jgi:hypothetical protein
MAFDVRLGALVVIAKRSVLGDSLFQRGIRRGERRGEKQKG